MNMRLQQSELHKSSEHLPKLLSFWYKISSLCFYPSTAAQQGDTIRGNTHREFCAKKTVTYKMLDLSDS